MAFLAVLGLTAVPQDCGPATRSLLAVAAAVQVIGGWAAWAAV
jgi:hypothetical protein